MHGFVSVSADAMKLEQALQKARSLLSQISESHKSEETRKKFNVDESLSLCFRLCTTFHTEFASKTAGEITLKDCAAIRAIVELIVRWGISPFLSPGVGIPRDKNSNSKQLTDFDGVLLRSCETLLAYAIDQDSSKDPFSVAFMARNYYLGDVVAGLLQIAYGGFARPLEREAALRRLEEATKLFEVGDLVEALLTLLGQQEPYPPPRWFNSEAGKLLSRLVMISGGVPAVMQRLLGQSIKGDVRAYERVSSHLAKVPGYVATVEEYYKAVCPQILPFLLDKSYGKQEAGEGEIAQQILKNIHYTSTLLACTMLVQEPGHAEVYLLKPVLLPLVKWANSFPNKSTSHEQGSEASETKVTEKEILESFMQLQSFIIAGHASKETVRKIILEKTRFLLPELLILHYLLETVRLSKPVCSKTWVENSSSGITKKPEKNDHDQGNTVNSQKDISQQTSPKPKYGGLAKGFLDRSPVENHDEEADNNTFGRLKSSVNDLMIAHILDFSESSVEMMSDFLSLPEADIRNFSWPCMEGELWNVLNPCNLRTCNPANHLSKLLLESENWSMVLRLMGAIFRKVTTLHHCLHNEFEQMLLEGNNVQMLKINNIQQLMESFETLNDVVGSMALERDSVEASSLIKDLLKEASLLIEEDIIELLLHMVHNVLLGLKARSSEYGPEEIARENLITIKGTLKHIWKICPSQKVKRMSSTLSTRIDSLLG